MSKVTPYLTLYNAMEAIDFYKEVFHGEVVGEIDMLNKFEGFENYPDHVAHCALRILDTIIFINDNLESDPLKEGDHIQLTVVMDSEEELRRAFELLKDNGLVFNEIQEVPWGKLGGTVRDKYHVTWMMFVE